MIPHGIDVAIHQISMRFARINEPFAIKRFQPAVYCGRVWGNINGRSRGSRGLTWASGGNVASDDKYAASHQTTASFSSHEEQLIRPPDSMRPTVFTQLYLVAIMLSGIIGAQFGYKWFGLPGGTIGLLVGGVFGHTMGCVMSSAMNRVIERNIRQMSTARLRAKLDEEGISSTYLSSLIISILLERGEAAESLREYIFRQLKSGDVCEWRAGLRSLAFCYPALASTIDGFNPVGPTPEDLESLKEIEAKCVL